MSATLAAELFTLPFCTIKSVYVTNLGHKSMRDSVRHILDQRGFRGFFDSSKPAVISQLASTTSKYTLYEFVKKYRHTDSKSIVQNVLNGMIGGSVSSLITHPIDVWKVHKQNGLSISTELKNQGTHLIYRGFRYTVQKNMVLTGIIFPSYDLTKSCLTSAPYLAPIISSFLSTLLIHPFDVRKTRGIMGNHQTQSLSVKQKISYYYRGLHLSFMRSIPHFSITMWCIEFFKSWWNKFC